MKTVMLWLIRFYRVRISPHTPPTCRYMPTCSEYAVQAIEKYGAFRGGWLTLKRLMRCHPFSRHNPYDPVP